MTTAPSPTFPTLEHPPALFRDDLLEQRFRRDGHVVVPFLDRHEVAAIDRAYWSEVADPGDQVLAIDFDREDRGPMRRARALVEPLVGHRIRELFAAHRLVFATFVVKHPNPDSNMAIHEDRTWVDERAHRSATVWIPLVDVGAGLPNGHLEVVPRSHRLGQRWSGSNTPAHTRPWDPWLEDQLVPLDVSAGHAVIYDSRTLHASPPNRSDAPRVALALGVVPVDAQLIHVVASGTSARSIYAVDEDFYLRHGPSVPKAAMPEGYELLEVIDEPTTLGEDDVAWAMGKCPPVAIVPIPPDVASGAHDEPWPPLEPSSGRAELAAGHRWRVPSDRDITVEVLDAPPVGAGSIAADGPAALRRGLSVEVPRGGVIWNDGPGALVIAATAR